MRKGRPVWSTRYRPFGDAFRGKATAWAATGGADRTTTAQAAARERGRRGRMGEASADALVAAEASRSWRPRVCAGTQRSEIEPEQHVVERVDHLLQLRLGRDEGRRQQDRVSVGAVRDARARVDDEPGAQAGLGDPRRLPVGPRERAAQPPALHDLDAPQEAPPAHVADVRPLAQPLQGTLHERAQRARTLDDLLALEEPEDGA